jgi:Pentapeptide repeats (9 copies)/Pentapeptide repeats (8 copies)
LWTWDRVFQTFHTQQPGASFVGANLIDIEFSQCNLTNANFSDARMRKVFFYEVDLTGANLKKGKLVSSLFSDSVLNNIDLEFAYLVKAQIFQCTCLNVNFSNADMTEINIGITDVRNSNFSNALLKHSRLGRNNFRQSDFTGANLQNAHFYTSNLSNVNFANVKSLNTVRFSSNTFLRTILNAGIELKNSDITDECTEFLEIIDLIENVPVIQPVQMINKFDKINAFDFIMYGEEKISDVPDGNVIFYIKDQTQGFSYPRDAISDGYDDIDSLFIACNQKSKHLSVSMSEAKLGVVYYRLNITIPIFIEIGQIKALLASNHKEWFLEMTSEIEEFTSSMQLLHEDEYTGNNIFNDELDAVSKDHCQLGTRQNIYKLSPLKFLTEVRISPKKNVAKSVKHFKNTRLNTTQKKSP